jgi:hypothetical protein
MKKLVLMLAITIMASIAFGQIVTKQITFGTKTADSISGGAPSGGTVNYFYFNFTGTPASAIVKATRAIKDYQIIGVEVAIGLPTKASDMVDSCQITLEISYDNVNWVKWTNAGATTPATQTQYYNGGPRVLGTGVYTYAFSTRDMVTTTTTAGGCIFQPVGCLAPYSRVKITGFKASSSAYPIINYVLKAL